MIPSLSRIAVIGSGTMGNGIAHVFAQAGYQVNLCDLSQEALERALGTIAQNMDRQIKKGSLDEAGKQAALARIAPHTQLAPAVADRDLIIEAVSENEAVKQKLFRELDEAAPAHAILASNTSSISITRIAAATRRSSQVVGMHFMNPVPVMKLVEVISGYNTSPETLQQVLDLSRDLGKVPAPSRDYPGFISNRILMPMINEAICALFEGVAEAQDIDSIMKLGMAHPMGPLELADFIGLDVCLAILEVLHEGFGNPKYAPCPLLRNMVAAGRLGRKSGQGFYTY